MDGAHEALRPGGGAAFGVEAAGAERLVVLAEVNYGPRPDPGPLVGAVQKAMSLEHGVLADAVAILKPGTLEKTSSGKVRRRAAKARFESDDLAPLHLWRGWS